MRKKIDLSDYGCGMIILIVIVALALVFGGMCFEAWIFMLLWNWIVPIFWATAPHLGFWVSFGVMMLLNLIGGFFKSRVSVNRD